LEHLGTRRPDRFEGGVQVVGAEDRSLQRTLSDQRQQRVALGLRTTAVRLGQNDVDVLTGRSDGDPAESAGGDVVTHFQAQRVAVETERGIGIVDGDEHRGDGDCHVATVGVPARRPLLHSCSNAGAGELFDVIAAGRAITVFGRKTS
jgi:hypothetical protein